MEQNNTQENKSEETTILENQIVETIRQDGITLHRIFSWFLNIFLIAPFYIISCVCKIPFNFFNGLHYINFKHWYVFIYNSLIENHSKIIKNDTAYHIASFFTVLVGMPITLFITDLQQLKTLKF